MTAPDHRSDAGLQFALKIAIAAMGVMIVLGLGAVAVRIMLLAPRSGNPAPPLDQTLALPPGAAVRSLALSGPRLAVHYTAPEGDGVAILDVETGRVAARIRVAPGNKP